METKRWAAIAMAIGLMSASSAGAGDLNPPGAPGPTMHSLEELYQKLTNTLAEAQAANQKLTNALAEVHASQQMLTELKQRLAADGMAEVMNGMVLIPAGSFEMGDCFSEGNAEERPRHTVDLSAFYMDQYEVTKAKWDEVYTWAVTNGYSFTHAGSGKASSHPVHSVYWYDCVKWCNARSQKEGRTLVYRYMTFGPPPLYLPRYNVYLTGDRDDIVMYDNGILPGYRLPTEAEWEKAARGGATGRRFPWSSDNTIQHARANYSSSSSYGYDTSPTRGYHPSYTNAPTPYTSPVGSFLPNGYGLYDMAGNVWEWCWDWYDASYYSVSPGTNPIGPDGPLTAHVLRGGTWWLSPNYLRCSFRIGYYPGIDNLNLGFRCVRGL